MISESVRGVKDATEVPADLVGMMLNTFNPLGGESTVMQTISPTALDPIVQIIENTDAFGRPLGPTQFPGQELTPDSQMSWLSEPKGYKWLAREMNQLTGGSAAEQGLMDWRPSTYRVLAHTLMGSGGKFVGQVGSSAMGLMTGNPPKIKDAPVLRTFFFDPNDPIEASQYHERIARIEQAKKAEKVFSTGPERDLGELQRVRGEYSGELRMVQMAKDSERQIKDLRKQLRTAEANGQETRVEMLKKKIEKIRERFNVSWNRRVGN